MTPSTKHPEHPASDLLLEAHKRANEHIEACWAAFHAEQEAEDGDEIPASPASAPFNGCQTCETREILFAAWPLLRQAALAGYPA